MTFKPLDSNFETILFLLSQYRKIDVMCGWLRAGLFFPPVESRGAASIGVCDRCVLFMHILRDDESEGCRIGAQHLYVYESHLNS